MHIQTVSGLQGSVHNTVLDIHHNSITGEYSNHWFKSTVSF